MAGTHFGIWYWITVGDVGKHFLLMVHLPEGRMKWHLLSFIAAFSICWKWFVFVTGLIKKKKKERKKSQTNKPNELKSNKKILPTERFSAIRYFIWLFLIFDQGTYVSDVPCTWDHECIAGLLIIAICFYLYFLHKYSSWATSCRVRCESCTPLLSLGRLWNQGLVFVPLAVDMLNSLSSVIWMCFSKSRSYRNTMQFYSVKSAKILNWVTKNNHCTNRSFFLKKTHRLLHI